MKITGLMPCRGDAWILPLSLPVALSWCDDIVLWNHMPDPDTEALLRRMPLQMRERITHVTCTEPSWNEMGHRQAMIEVARSASDRATHLALIDSDEVASLGLRSRMRDYAEKLDPGQIAQFPMVNLRRGWFYHTNGMWSNRRVSAIWRENGSQLGYTGDKFHAREPQNSRQVFFPHEDPILHFWGFSEERLIERHRAYRVTERIRYPYKNVRDIEEMYGWATRGRGQDTPERWKFAPVPEGWISMDDRRVVRDEYPCWQTGYVEDMIRQYGRQHFAGLEI